METQDFNKELLDYLYGEMTAGEKVEFERKISEDADLRREYEDLNSVRQELDKLKDKEVMEPFSTWGRSRSSHWFGSNSRRRIIVFRPITAVAASPNWHAEQLHLRDGLPTQHRSDCLAALL